jgi:hypothetical protein
MRRALSGSRRHFSVRLRAAATDPSALLVLVGAGLASALLWPGATGPGGAGWRVGPTGAEAAPPEIEMMAVLLWMLLWPVLPVTAATGRAAATSRGDALALRAHPALPVRVRARMLAEALLVLVFIAAAWLVRLALPHAPEPAAHLATLACGALLAFPMLLAWTAPAPSFPLLWMRPVVVLAALLGAMQAGFLATPGRLAATAATLSALVLLAGDREPRWPSFFRWRWTRSEPLWRPALPPGRRLRRDFLVEPIRRLGLVAGLLVLLQAAVLVADHLSPLPPIALLVVSAVTFGQILGFALRPAGSALIAWGFRGRSGSRTGDLARAWSVLPVRPEAVRRAAWMHGLVVSLGVWAGAALFIAARTWLREGRPGLLDADGDSLLPLLLLALCVVPVAAGLVASATAGDGKRMAMSGGALLGLFNLPGIVLVLTASLAGRGSRAPVLAAVGTIAILTLVGALPPLALLWRHSRRPERRTA